MKFEWMALLGITLANNESLGEKNTEFETYAQKRFWHLSVKYPELVRYYSYFYPLPFQNAKERSFWQNFFLASSTGAMAGCSIAYLTFPIEALKKWLQAHLDKNATLTKKPEDQLRWYRGSSIFAVNIIPTTMLQYTFKNFANEWIDSQYYLKSLVASFMCGVVGAPTATMVERAVVYQQKLKTDKILPAFKAMYNDGGYTGLMRSFPMIAARDGIFTTWMFKINPTIALWAKNNLGEAYSLPLQLLTACLFGATITHPFDVIATEMQQSKHPISIKQASLNLWNKNKTHESLIKHAWSTFSKGLYCRWALFPFYAVAIPAFDNLFNRRINSQQYQESDLAQKWGLFKLTAKDNSINESRLDMASSKQNNNTPKHSK